MQRALDRLDARFVFVVGKGGVGKSTTAAALALGSADRGVPTRLVSTDPAHSVADVFEHPAADSSEGAGDAPPVVDRVCGVPLIAEAFDARRHYERWMHDASGPIEELVEMGSYLDREDAASFLGLSLPGLDELMGALRLVEVGEGPEERIVVDTAPTGHALRLLEAGGVLAAWTRALRAMERKASAVAEGLTHQAVRLKAEEVVGLLEDEVRRFEVEVLAPAAFVVVTRSGPVVQRETDALVRVLEARGQRVVLRVHVGATGPADAPSSRSDVPLLRVDWDPPMTGCERLRAWGRARRLAGPGADGRGRGPVGAGTEAERRTEGKPRAVRDPRERPAGRASAPGSCPVLPLLTGRLVFFAGKGGVGKSTCASAAAAALGTLEPTTLVGVDPAGSLHALWGCDVTDGGVEVDSGLRLVQVEARRRFEAFVDRNRSELRRMLEALGVGVESPLDRNVMDALLGVAPPGIDEIFALIELADRVDEGGAVIVDAAPTGHFLRLVELPDVALGWIHSLMKVLLKYRSVVGLDRTAEELLEIARRLRAVRAILRNADRCGVILVTLDEPVVAAETLRLHRELIAARIPVAGRIRNRVVDAEDGDGAPAVPTFVAPEMEAAGGEGGPRGREALGEFASRWRRVA